MFRVIKESETVDARQHCFLLQSSPPDTAPRYLSLETRQELLRIENSWNSTIITSVIKLGVSSNKYNRSKLHFELIEMNKRDWNWKWKKMKRKCSKNGTERNTNWTNFDFCSLFFLFVQRKTFAVSYQGRSGGLTLDWQTGFSLTEGADANIVWQYKFSQLRGSSDDGKSKLKLHFHDPETRSIDTKVSVRRKWHAK